MDRSLAVFMDLLGVSPTQSVAVRKRNRRSRFEPFRKEILKMYAKGRPLNFILRKLECEHPGCAIPRTTSQLSRFIRNRMSSKA